MLRISYDEMVEKIKSEKGLSDGDINARVEKKLKQLSDLISKEGAIHIIANELGVKIADLTKRSFKIKDLLVGLRNIELVAKVLQKYDVREFKKEDRVGRVANLLVGDETGSVKIVIWDNKLIDIFGNSNEGDVIKIRGGSVRENRGYKEIHLSGYSNFIVNPEGESVGEVVLSQAKRVDTDIKKIKELKANEFASICGTVVQVFDPRFYDACPECNRKVRIEGEKSFCASHGEVQKKSNLILNLFFDDGSENMRVVAFRDTAVALLGIKEEEALKLRNNPEGFESIRENILGKQVVLNGKVNKNDMFDRLEFNANSVRDFNVVEKANELIVELK